MRIHVVLFLLAALCVGSDARAQVGADSLRTVTLREVVVTATRTPRSLERVPVPTLVFTGSDGQVRGAKRVADILGERAGLRVVRNQFGAGLQLRGLDPAYTLVLIDGQPVTARTNGTVDLDRVPTEIVERIEVVKGASSSLYGSEALAGVVNIITRRPQDPLFARFDTGLETHGTDHLGMTVGGVAAEWSSQVSVNRYRSDGYDLQPNTPGSTAPSFKDLSLAGSMDYERDNGLRVRLRTRLSSLNQQSDAGTSGSDHVSREGREVALAVHGRVARAIEARLNLAGAKSGNRTTFAAGLPGVETSTSDFNLDYRKAEAQLDWIPSPRHRLISGGGFVGEVIGGTRIAEQRRTAQSAFAYVQHEHVRRRLQTSASLRIDGHSGFGYHVSPKLAVMVSADRARYRGSVGRGFKAPTFQQLFLDFSNPGPGYSVVGTRDLQRQLDRFAAAGQVAHLLGDPTALPDLVPESAWSADLGVDLDLRERGQLSLGVFRTALRDMIETRPIAAKTNGQFIFTYANVSRVLVAGADAAVDWTLSDQFRVAGSYQYLRAVDRDVVASIRAGRLFRREDGRDTRLNLSDYGGLFNRSRHSASASALMSLPRTTVSLRAIYQHRYGFGDTNGNLILDARSEYAPSHVLVNATIVRRLGAHTRLEAAVQNLTGVRHPTTIPSLSGRVVRVGIAIETHP